MRLNLVNTAPWRRGAAALAAALVLGLAGCDRAPPAPAASSSGATSGTASEAASSAPALNAGSVSSEARTTGFPVTIDSALGQAVIAAPPRRVVTLGLGADDLALALGVVPVGTSRADWGGDADHYWPWVRAAIQALSLIHI